jgi:hypothetical protein
MTVEIVKSTALPAKGLVIMTTRRADPYSLRPFQTFALDTNGVTYSVADFATSAAALLRHEQLERDFNIPIIR